MGNMISVIVPVYNVEKYLDECIESIVSQSYTNFELILVDDGSPDKCPEICDEWAKRDNRIKVIHKENGGVSSARNAGIDAASGEFIMFIDSDDTIRQGCFERSVEMITKHDADICFFGYKIRKHERLLNSPFKIRDVIECDRKQLYELLFVENVINTIVVTMKLYKTSIIKNNGIYFDTSIDLGEDNIFGMQAFNVSDKFVIDNESYYVVRRGIEGTLSNKYRDNHFESIQHLADKKLELVKNSGASNEALFGLKKTLALSFFNVLHRHFKSKSKRSMEMIKKVSKTFPIREIKTKDINLSKKEKIAYIFLRMKLYLPVYFIFTLYYRNNK